MADHDMSSQELIANAQAGLRTLPVNPQYVEHALTFLEQWLTKDEFKEYVPQLQHLIQHEHWNYLLDSFYQVIPFGTGGRRGEVGIGTNRINPWTIRTSAQGHSQYLLKTYGEDAKTRGVVLAYDVREFFGNAYFNNALPNPVQNLTSKDLTIAAAQVYAANGIRVYLFPDVRTTPELSFTIRRLHAVAGAMFSASHNPPEHNGKKVYDEHGGQLIPPHDEALINEVTKNVREISAIGYEEAVRKHMIIEIGMEVDQAYIAAAAGVSLSSYRGIKIIFSAMHGCGMTSVYPVLKHLGFEVVLDEHTSNPSGKFENITFNIPNPEVIQSFDATLLFAQGKNADIILSSDPDADRIGIMVWHLDKWVFLNGNEIAALLGSHAIQKRKKSFTGNEVMVKTVVTTNLLQKMCNAEKVRMIGDLLIGFKYVADAMNTIEQEGNEKGFLFGCEESHSYLAGTYARDKDAANAAVWLAELAAELKEQGKTLVDELDRLYVEYGYFKNYLTEIRLLGASGKEKIDRIQSSLRNNPPTHFGKYKVKHLEDGFQQLPIVSETDKVAKDILMFHLEPIAGTESIKVTVRPSGTEPKTKMYFEIGAGPVVANKLSEVKEAMEHRLADLEKEVMLTCYKILGVDFPERGFLLFWQLSLDHKMKYFEVEPQIEQLTAIQDKDERKKQLFQLIAFLGSNPIEKFNDAFKAKHGVSVLEFLHLV